MTKQTNKTPISKDVVDLIVANPDLPIHAMVGYEVVADEDRCFWYAPRCTASIEEIVQEEVIDDERLWIKRRDRDDMLERYGDKLNCSDLNIDYNTELKCFVRVDDPPRPIPDHEIDQLAEQYVDSLPWEQCILLLLDV